MKALVAETIDPSYKNLYRLAAVAACVVVVLTLSEVIAFAIYPQPATVGDWFTLLQTNPVIGLVDFWLLEVPMYLMFIPVFLALYMVLRKNNPGLMVIALALALLGIALFLSTNNPFSMLSLGNRYAAATTDGERSTLLAAGQALIANTGQRAVGGFNMALLLVSIAGLIVSFVMLRSNTFSRSTGYVGIVAYVLSLADYLRQTVTQAPVLALLVILPGALFLVIWYVMVGVRLYQLGRLEKPLESSTKALSHTIR